MRICLNMIVKNEAPVIERCLRSVRPHIHAWAIVDTGSSDGTQNLVRNFLHDLPGELIDRPWVDFSTNRNEALELARGRGDYALFIDADDTLAVDGDRVADLTAPCYVIESVVQGVGSWIEALARLDIDWSWHGVLHELLTSTPGVPREKLAGVRLRKYSDGARSRSGLIDKYKRDADILRRALEAEPGNARYQFYLAQSLRESRQWRAALTAYQRRSEVGGWDEEIYFCKLMIAVLSEQIGASDTQIVQAYLQARRFRPQRAESLMRLAHFLLKRGRYEQARDCALAACALPPTTDTLLVDHSAYGWRSRDDLAIALFHLGDKAGCVAEYRVMLVDPALPGPERDRVQRNLKKLEGSD
jgi:glycosyltransferase involved in cell wall biosynthesis